MKTTQLLAFLFLVLCMSSGLGCGRGLLTRSRPAPLIPSKAIGWQNDRVNIQLPVEIKTVGTSRFAEATSLVDRIGVQPDGKLLLVGSSREASDQPSQLTMVRYLPDGNPDPQFGKLGIVKALRDVSADPKSFLLVGAEGSILVAGSYTKIGDFNTHPFLAKFAPSGKLDPAFGESGVLELQHSAAKDLIPTVLATQKNGAILVGGTKRQGGLFVMRLTSTQGKIDETFAKKGILVFSKGMAEWMGDMLVDANEKILISGNYFDEVPKSQDETIQSSFVTRLSADGAVDPEFGESGGTTDFYPLFIKNRSMMLLPSGELILASYLRYTLDEFVFWNLGLDGKKQGDKPFVSLDPTQVGEVQEVSYLPDGTFSIVGSRMGEISNVVSFESLNLDGSLNTSFRSGGRFEKKISLGEGITASAILPDGTTVYAGSFSDQKESSSVPSWYLARIKF